MIKMYRLYKLTEESPFNVKAFIGDFDNETQMERYILDNQLRTDEYEVSIVYTPNPIVL